MACPLCRSVSGAPRSVKCLRELVPCSEAHARLDTRAVTCNPLRMQSPSAHHAIAFIALHSVLVAACARVDGAETAVTPAGRTCTTDFDCGPGRYCDGSSLCAIDCVAAKDCVPPVVDFDAPNEFACSPCGRCIPAGARDGRCVQAPDVPCAGDDECPAGSACGAAGYCARRCATDDDCVAVGRGWTCGGAGRCERRCFSEADCVFHGWNYACALPAWVDPSANAIAADPVYGECLPRIGGVHWDSSGSPEEPSRGYRGVWGMLYAVAFRASGIPLLNTQDSVNIQYDLVKVAQKERGLLIEYKVCAAELRNFRENDAPFEDFARLVTPDAFIDSLGMMYNLVAVPPQMAPGASFTTDTGLSVLGARLDDPARDPLPTYRDPANQYDQDRDGNPGMTMLVTGAMSGEMYVAQRSRYQLSCVVVDADHLQGPVLSDTEQAILGASKDALVYDMTLSAHPQADRSYFRAVRLPDTASCGEVIELGGMKRGWLTFEPHYDPARLP